MYKDGDGGSGTDSGAYSSSHLELVVMVVVLIVNYLPRYQGRPPPHHP